MIARESVRGSGTAGCSLVVLLVLLALAVPLCVRLVPEAERASLSLQGVVAHVPTWLKVTLVAALYVLPVAAAALEWGGLTDRTTPGEKVLRAAAFFLPVPAAAAGLLFWASIVWAGLLAVAAGVVVIVAFTRLRRFLASLAFLLPLATGLSAQARDAAARAGAEASGAPAVPDLPRISVLPVIFVPRGERVPTSDERALLAAHLDMSRRRYIELLAGRDSFLVEPEPFVHLSDRSMAWFREAYDQGASELVAELLRARGVGRYDAPHVYAVVIMNDREDFPPGAGRPINGGLGTGAGLLMVSSTGLTKSRNFQSTLEHELGHAFGLVHADAYGEDMYASRSLMSYDQSHHTNGLRPSATPGELLPVEILSLALNRRVFPALTRGEALVAPPSTRPGVPDLWWLPPMTIEGYPAASPTVTTPSGEEYGTRVSRVVLGRTRPDAGPGVTFDAGNMWHSSASPDGWVELDITFPEDVTLTGLGLHTGHSGLYHHAVELSVEVEGEGEWHLVSQSPVRSADCMAELPASSGRTWRVRLKSGSGMVTVRGLEFRGASGEDIYPPLVREAPPARESCRDR
jgi:hypothetical protein